MDPTEGARQILLPTGASEEVVVEEPLILRIEGEDLVTMRTPGQDQDLARGFLVSERIVPDVAGIHAMEAFIEDEVDGLEIRLADGLKARGGRLTRVHEIRASCGLCGVPSIEGIAKDLPMLVPGAPKVGLALLAELSRKMRAGQGIFERTGGSHAAALCRGTELLFMAEDVGRHNAVDKVIGAALVAGIDFRDCSMILSGRSGFELLMKGLRMGVPVFASVSAATSFSVALAEEAGATLVGFLRDGNGVVYCDDGRLC